MAIEELKAKWVGDEFDSAEFEITEERPTSLPVPAVVGTAIINGIAQSIGRPLGLPSS